VWTLTWLRRHGVTEAIINLHHLGRLIQQALGDGSAYGMKLSYSHEPTILGTGGGIKQAEAFFQGEPFVVVNGDTLLELDLAAMRRHHQQRGALATMALRADPDAARWGEVLLDEAGDIRAIAGRPAGARGRGGHMFAGVHLMDARLLADVPSGQESSIIDAYVRALESGARIGGFAMAGYWSDVGTPERYAEVQRDAESGRIALRR
jgi:NDP-sugar pyrophosphorylase family protein